MTDDTNKQESGLAETLYHAYQANRHDVKKVSVSIPIGSRIEDNQSSPSAELLFRQHQQQRFSGSGEVSVDSVLDLFREESGSLLISQRDQPDSIGTTPAIESVSATEGRMGGEVKASNAANERQSSWWKRLSVGVAAALLLGFVFIPQLMKPSAQSGSSLDSLPVALSNDAGKAKEYIDTTGAGSFGFSDNDSMAKKAFNLGVIAIDIRLSVKGADQQLSKTLLKSLLAAATDKSATNSDTEEIPNSIRLVYNAIDAGADKGEVSRLLQDSLNQIRASIIEGKQLDWYLAGGSVESIRVAAEVALEYSDLTALEQALATGKRLNTPVGVSPIEKQFSDLVNYSLQGKEKFIQVNEIKKMAEDIKLVMQ